MFFDFLKYCLGNEVDMCGVVSQMDWRQLYAFARKQAIVGFCLEGIERLGREYPEALRRNPIGQGLLMEWMARSQMIRRQNMKVNVAAAKLYALLRKDGLRCCVLKGQGNALMYPNPYARTPGDIDVWVNASRDGIMAYAGQHFTIEEEARYHHVGTSMDGVPVELHFFPGLMNNPVHNARLQEWFRRNADLQCSNVVSLPDAVGEMAVPTTAFNVIYQLSHLFHHFFDEGIGMRQIIDYYYVINDLSSSESRQRFFAKDSFSNHPVPKEGSTSHPSPLSSEERDMAGDAIALPEFLSASKVLAHKGLAGVPTQQSYHDDFRLHSAKYKQAYYCSRLHENCNCLTAGALQRELKHLGLLKFAGAVMYVLHEVLGMPEGKLIVPMDEKRGRLLLSEILGGGNFGKYFSRYGQFTRQGMAKKYFLKIWRNMHFVRYYPAEALSEPVFRTWHFFWRAWNRHSASHAG